MLRLSLCGVTDEAALKIVHDHLSKSPFCRVRRFYGNIVGISPRIMASGSLTLDTTPSWEHSLPNDVHVTHSWVEQEVCFIRLLFPQPLAHEPRSVLAQSSSIR
jgi:hypothetical protein